MYTLMFRYKPNAYMNPNSIYNFKLTLLFELSKQHIYILFKCQPKLRSSSLKKKMFD